MDGAGIQDQSQPGQGKASSQDQDLFPGHVYGLKEAHGQCGCKILEGKRLAGR